MAFQPPDPNKEIDRRRNHLPHWKQDGVTLFVTYRLGDSIPQAKLHIWEQERAHWLERHGIVNAADFAAMDDELRQKYHQLFTDRFHEWLDAGLGSCLLRSPTIGQIVAEGLQHFNGMRYAMEAYVVMPNHVHVLFTPAKGVDSSGILHTWKSYSSHVINVELDRQGELWQKERCDRLVRDEAEFAYYRRYIRSNPDRAKLRDAEFVWWDALGEPA